MKPRPRAHRTPAQRRTWFTPITNIGASADGAEMITFLAPPAMCIDAFSITVKMPVDSHTMSEPVSPHGTSFGLRIANCLLYTSPSPRDRG